MQEAPPKSNAPPEIQEALRLTAGPEFEEVVPPPTQRPKAVRAPKKSKKDKPEKIRVPMQDRSEIFVEKRMSWHEIMTEDVRNEIRAAYHKDQFFKKVIEQKDLANPNANFKCIEGFWFHKRAEDSNDRLCIPKIEVKGIDIRQAIISEAHTRLAHCGNLRTLKYIQNYVYWPGLAKEKNTMCDHCETCQRIKPMSGKYRGLLHPLQQPTRPWGSVGMDFSGPYELGQ